MIVVDSSALIAVLRDEPEADRFAWILAREDASLLSSVSLLEISLVLAGRYGDETAWTGLDSLILHSEIRVVAFDNALATAARHAFLRYGKGCHPAALNMGDCASYALAKQNDLPLLFKGHDFSQTDLSNADHGA